MLLNKAIYFIIKQYQKTFYWIFNHSLGLTMSESVSLNSAAFLKSSNTKTQNKTLLIKIFYLKNGARSTASMPRPLLAVKKLNNKLSTEEKCYEPEGNQGSHLYSDCCQASPGMPGKHWPYRWTVTLLSQGHIHVLQRKQRCIKQSHK